MKKLLSLFLSFVMFLSVFTGISFSALAQAYGDYEYTVSNGAATITDYLGGDTVITIPSEINGYPVKKIGNYAFESCYSLTSVTIPNSVTSIGESAFQYCADLLSVVIPDSVKIIGDSAFNLCSGLESVIIPNSVTTIGYMAFYCCENLTDIEIPNSVTNIGNYAFESCNSLTNVTIPNSLTSIGEGLFYGCYNLINIIIPDSVTSIGNYAFYECKSLTSVTIPNSVKYIGDSIFTNLETLNYEGSVAEWITVINNSDEDEYYSPPNSNAENFYINGDLTIPSDIAKIPAYAFINCQNLTNVAIPDGVTSIGDYAFYNCSGLVSATVPSSVKYIGSSVFSSLYNNTYLEMFNYEGSAGEWLTIINNSNIEENYSLPNINAENFYINGDLTIPSDIAEIPAYSFQNCKNLKSITLSNSVIRIGECAFSGCGLTEIIIPDTVISIGDFAFYECESLTSATIPNSVKYIGDSIFANLNLDTINYEGSAEEWLTIISNSADDEYYSPPNSNSENFYINGDLTIPSDITEIPSYAFRNCKNLTAVTIPDSITSIGTWAFGNCYNLTSVTIPNSVKYIGDSIFANLNLETLDYGGSVAEWLTVIYNSAAGGYYSPPNSYAESFYINGKGDYTISSEITEIPAYTFSSCKNLTSFNIPDSVISIGDYAFYNCEGLTDIDIHNKVTSIGNNSFCYCSSLKSVTIPNSVTSIGYNTFSNCVSLTSVTIPSNVKAIGSSSFSGSNSLKEILVDSANKNYCSVDGVLFNKDKTELVSYPNGKSDSLYKIPESVRDICDFAFSGCSNLKNLTIPDSVTSIGVYSLSHCSSLESIKMGGGVADIGEAAFIDCSKLKNIYVDSSNKNYCTVNGILFNKDKTELVAYPNGKSDSSYKIPESVQSINDYAFYICNAINSVIISKNVNYIGYMSFVECKNINDVYFEGDEATWKKIAYTHAGNEFPNATIHYNYNYDSEEKKPDAPTGFDVTGTGNQGTLLYLDWEDSANADGYRMYVVSGDKEYYKGEVTESLFKFTDLTAGWNYSLRIEAFNSAGTASTETTICAAPAPMTADDITLSTSGSKLNISWEKQTCTGYVVQWSTDSSFKNITGTKYIDKPWNTSYSVSISNQQNYYVRVRAYKTYNGMTSYGDFSPAVKEKVLPGTITGFDIIGTGNKGSLLYLDWNGMANTDGYKVYVVSGEKEYLKGTTKDSQFKFTDLTPGWNYTVKVVAYNADGETATTTTICAAPATMTTDDFTAKASGNKLNISWDKQTCTGYVVQWSTDSSFKNITGTKYIDKPWNTSYTVSVSNPQNYYVRVRAYKTYNGMTAYGDFSPAEKAVK